MDFKTPITLHILKAYDESYSKIIREHKYKDNEKDDDKDKDKDKVPEIPSICYIFIGPRSDHSLPMSVTD